jgi:hypothetical protein
VNWLRLYSKILHDVKVQSLDPPIFKTWINILCLASEQDPRGFLPEAGEAAFALHMFRVDYQEALDALFAAGLIETAPSPTTGELRAHVHNWDKYQYESDDVTERVRRFRSGESRPTPGRPRKDRAPAVPGGGDAAEPALADPAGSIGETFHETFRGNNNTHSGNVPRNVVEQNRIDPDPDPDPDESETDRTRAPEFLPLSQNDHDWWLTTISNVVAPQEWYSREWLGDQRDTFLLKSRGRGKVASDWKAEFRAWMLREKSYLVRDQREQRTRRASKPWSTPAPGGPA